MSKKRKVLIIVLIVVVIIAIAITFLAVNGKKKTDFVLDIGRSMYEFNENIGKSDNVYSKYTYNSDYFEYYVFGDISKSIQVENGVITTRILTPTQIIEYKEINGDKIMSILPAEDEYTEDGYEEDDYTNIDYNEEDYKPSIIDNISGFFDVISYGIKTKLTTDTVDGKECYVITTSEGKGEQIQYADKATKVIFKTISTETSSKGEKLEQTTTFEYSFGTVTADDVKELDSSEYTLLSEEEFDNYE